MLSRNKSFLFVVVFVVAEEDDLDGEEEEDAEYTSGLCALKNLNNLTNVCIFSTIRNALPCPCMPVFTGRRLTHHRGSRVPSLSSV
jgi:hypothetical protein